MDVILGDEVKTPSVTSREYIQAENGFVVSTRLPQNIFSFRANGEPVTIRGSVELQFVGSGRKLRVDNIFDVDAPRVKDKARYEVKVNLLSDGADGDGMMAPSSAKSITSIGGYVASVCLAFSLVFIF